MPYFRPLKRVKGADNFYTVKLRVDFMGCVSELFDHEYYLTMTDPFTPVYDEVRRHRRRIIDPIDLLKPPMEREHHPDALGYDPKFAKFAHVNRI